MASKGIDSRREFLKKSSVIGLATGLPASVLGFHVNHRRKPRGKIVGSGGFKYHVDKEWGVQDFSKLPVSDCHEMVQSKSGLLYMLTNHTRNNMLVYNKDGIVKDSWTLGFHGAHGLTLVNEGGAEYLFITDSEQSKVVKTDLKGRVLLEISYPKMIKEYQSASDWKPTESTVAPNGDIYIADGYGLNFITIYDNKGKFKGYFGGKGTGKDQFDCCHGVTFDTRNPDYPQLLITSRSQQQFKRFALDGKHLETIDIPGCWVCRPVIKGENLYFAVIVTKSWGAYDGMIAVLDKNHKVVSLPGSMGAPAFENGILIKPDSDLDTFLNPHDVCVDEDENLYIPQWMSGRTYPIKLERV